MRLSRYLQTRRLDGGITGVYSPFGHEFAYVEQQAWDRLQAGDLTAVAPALLSDLVERRIVVEEGFEDHILSQYLPPPEHIREMWLVVEQSCNMACQYCVTEGNVRDPGRRVPEGASTPAAGRAHHARTDT